MYLIFDFDGTLVNSFDGAIEKFNVLADEFNFKKISVEESLNLKDLSSQELIKYLKIPLYKIPRILSKARKYMQGDITKLTPFLSLPPILEKFHSANYSLGILTSNSKENVTTWLKTHQMTHLFDFIHSKSSYFGKTRVLKKILDKYTIDKFHALYIGDETRDIEAAKQNNIYSIAVTWGFNSEKALLNHNPHYIARQPEDLISIINSILRN